MANGALLWLHMGHYWLLWVPIDPVWADGSLWNGYCCVSGNLCMARKNKTLKVPLDLEISDIAALNFEGTKDRTKISEGSWTPQTWSFLVKRSEGSRTLLKIYILFWFLQNWPLQCLNFPSLEGQHWWLMDDDRSLWVQMGLDRYYWVIMGTEASLWSIIDPHMET